MIKSLILLFVITSKTVFAGEFSKIDHAVREGVEQFYSQSWDDDEAQSEFDREDIWGLELSNQKIPQCFVVVTGFVKKGIAEKKGTYQFTACVAKDKFGNYEAFVLEDGLVADE